MSQNLHMRWCNKARCTQVNDLGKKDTLGTRFRLMIERDKRVCRRMCEKRSVSVTAFHIHLNLTRGGIGGNVPLT